MCVIIYKPAGVMMPGDQILKTAAAANRDGCGLMTASGYIHKCLYDNLDQFLDKLHSLPKDEAAAVHFRWATHGSVKVGNCHPFLYNDYAMMHNGVLPIASRHDRTDSQIFLRQSLGPLLDSFGAGSAVAQSLLTATGSRFAILDKKQSKIFIFGEWTMVDGVFYSNLRFAK